MSFPGPEDCNCCHGGQPCECCAMHGDDKTIAMRKAAPGMLEALESIFRNMDDKTIDWASVRAIIKTAKEES